MGQTPKQQGRSSVFPQSGAPENFVAVRLAGGSDLEGATAGKPCGYSRSSVFPQSGAPETL
jgi:hypothetical protein